MNDNSAPSLAELITVARSLAPPPPASDNLTKHATTVLTGIAGALVLWIGSSVSSTATTLAKLQTTLEQVQKDVASVQVAQVTEASKVSDLQASVAKQDGRINTLSDGLDRTRERVRILEGMPALPPRQPRQE